MKKVLKLMLFIVLISISSKVYAYDIENYYINATIEEDGNLLVEEYFELNGYYNGYEFSLVSDASSGDYGVYIENSSSYYRVFAYFSTTCLFHVDNRSYRYIWKT